MRRAPAPATLPSIASDAQIEFGNYLLLECIGRGGMGEAWKARRRDVPDAPLVVVKRILAEHAENPRFVASFVDEAHITASLHHEAIAQVLDFGQVNGEYFFAIEYVHGRTAELLMRWATGRGLPTVPVPVACYLAMRVLEGLQYAHAKIGPDQRELGIVHRDISPDNVLVGFDGAVKVADFGVAKSKLEGRAETQFGRLKGKWHYFSPEQARGAPLDGRSDVFAVGVLLYRLVCGRLPFEGTAVDAARKIVRGTFPPPRKVNPTLPQALAVAITRALEVERDRRFQSAREFARALRAVLEAGEPFDREEFRAFVHWALKKELEAEGLSPQVPPALQRRFDTWLQLGKTEGKKLKEALTTPKDAPTDILRTGERQERPPPRSRSFYWAAAALFVAGAAVPVALLVRAQRQQQAGAEAARRQQREAQLGRIDALHRSLAERSPKQAAAFAARIGFARRGAAPAEAPVRPGQPGSPGQAGELDQLERDLTGALAELERAAAVEAAAAKTAAASTADAGAEPQAPGPDEPVPLVDATALPDAVRLDLSSTQRIALSYARHNLSVAASNTAPGRKWSTKWPITIRVEAPGGSMLAVVGYKDSKTEAKGLRALDLPHRAELPGSTELRLIDWTPFADVALGTLPREGQIHEGELRRGVATTSVRLGRAQGGFLVLEGVEGHAAIELVRVPQEGDRPWSAVVHCDGRSRALHELPVRFESPRRCAVATIARSNAQGTVEIAIRRPAPSPRPRAP